MSFDEAFGFVPHNRRENRDFVDLKIRADDRSYELLHIPNVLFLRNGSAHKFQLERGQRLSDAVRCRVSAGMRPVVLAQDHSTGFLVRIVGDQLYQGGRVEVVGSYGIALIHVRVRRLR